MVPKAAALRLGLGIRRIIRHLLEKDWGWQVAFILDKDAVV
jgi:hypothetical protein